MGLRATSDHRALWLACVALAACIPRVSDRRGDPDGDALHGDFDLCPETPGPSELHGCETLTVDRALRGLNLAFRSAEVPYEWRLDREEGRLIGVRVNEGSFCQHVIPLRSDMTVDVSKNLTGRHTVLLGFKDRAASWECPDTEPTASVVFALMLSRAEWAALHFEFLRDAFGREPGRLFVGRELFYYAGREVPRLDVGNFNRYYGLSSENSYINEARGVGRKHEDGRLALVLSVFDGELPIDVRVGESREAIVDRFPATTKPWMQGEEIHESDIDGHRVAFWFGSGGLETIVLLGPLRTDKAPEPTPDPGPELTRDQTVAGTKYAYPEAKVEHEAEREVRAGEVLTRLELRPDTRYIISVHFDCDRCLEADSQPEMKMGQGDAQRTFAPERMMTGGVGRDLVIYEHSGAPASWQLRWDPGVDAQSKLAGPGDTVNLLVLSEPI